LRSLLYCCALADDFAVSLLPSKGQHGCQKALSTTRDANKQSREQHVVELNNGDGVETTMTLATVAAVGTIRLVENSTC
jgi:hypothetical protein